MKLGKPSKVFSPIEWQASAQSPCQNEEFVYTSQKLFKSTTQTLPAVHHPPRTPKLAPNTPRITDGRKHGHQ